MKMNVYGMGRGHCVDEIPRVRLAVGWALVTRIVLRLEPLI